MNGVSKIIGCQRLNLLEIGAQTDCSKERFEKDALTIQVRLHDMVDSKGARSKTSGGQSN